MNATRIFALAAVATLSIGVGAAMAQSGGPSAPDPHYGPALQFYHPDQPAARQAVTPSAVQAGSSDVDVMRPSTGSYDYSTIANPG